MRSQREEDKEIHLRKLILYYKKNKITEALMPKEKINEIKNFNRMEWSYRINANNSTN